MLKKRKKTAREELVTKYEDILQKMKYNISCRKLKTMFCSQKDIINTNKSFIFSFINGFIR